MSAGSVVAGRAVRLLLWELGGNGFRVPKGSLPRVCVMETGCAETPWGLPSGSWLFPSTSGSGLGRGRQPVAAGYTVAAATHPEPWPLWLLVMSTVVRF